MTRPAVTVASTPETWKYSATRKEPNAAIVVSAASIRCSEVRSETRMAAPPNSAPTTTPPSTIFPRVKAVATAV